MIPFTTELSLKPRINMTDEVLIALLKMDTESFLKVVTPVNPQKSNTEIKEEE